MCFQKQLSPLKKTANLNIL